MCVAGPSVMKGYHNNIAATDEVSLSCHFECYENSRMAFFVLFFIGLYDDPEVEYCNDQVMMNYHGTRYFRTGDLGKFQNVSGGSQLYITGRIKEQFKLENGKYVAPGPLEVAMQQSNYISQVRQYNNSAVGSGVVAESTDHLRLFCRYYYTVTINLSVSVSLYQMRKS